MKQLQEKEHDIQTTIINYLRYTGWCVMRLNSGMIPLTDYRGKRRMVLMGERGTPDLLCFRRTEAGMVRLLFIKVKRPGKKATPSQAQKMQELEAYGATCIIASSMEDVERALTKEIDPL